MIRLDEAMATIQEKLAAIRQIVETEEYQANAEAVRKRLDENDKLQREFIEGENWRRRRIPLHFRDVKEAATSTTMLVDCWLNGTRPFLVLGGNKGRGKTYAACRPLRTRSGLYVTASEMVHAGSYDREYWEELESTPYLVVDDLGAEPKDSKGYFEANLANLVDKRISKRTVITTNLSGADFKTRYSTGDMSRTWSRLHAYAQFAKCDGEDLRAMQLPGMSLTGAVVAE